jgi:hypothetical protein
VARLPAKHDYLIFNVRHLPGRAEEKSITLNLKVTSSSKALKPNQKPTRMSPTFAVKGKDSGAARILGSGTSGMCFQSQIFLSKVSVDWGHSRLISGNYRNR